MHEHNIIVSFVHGYENLDLNISDSVRPALWNITGSNSSVYSYIFPRNPEDFHELDGIVWGKPPLVNAKKFKKLPRFGFTGLQQHGNCLYAGSWNAVYEIDPESFTLKRIISNQLMSDLHGIWVDNHAIITVLTNQDTIVLSDFEGNIIEHFTIDSDLTVHRNDSLPEIDWRFVSKQYRGSCGRWHFNYVQRFEDEIWLTSRSASCFVVLNLTTRKAHLRLMNLCTPVLLHDGAKYNDKFFFTSIDGKVIIAEDGSFGNKIQRTKEKVDNPGLYRRDLISTVIRLEETEVGREPNWCRGLSCMDNIIYVTIDGRYGSDLSFGVLGLKEDGCLTLNKRLNWAEIGDEKELRYVTGFDVCLS